MRSSSIVLAFAVLLPAAPLRAQDLPLPAAIPVTTAELAAFGQTIQVDDPARQPQDHWPPDLQAPDRQAPDQRAQDQQPPDRQAPDQRAQDKQSQDQKPPDQKPPDQKPPDKKDQPPAAVGEESKKPVRNFPSALVHNLADDIKHMPRTDSLYWLGGGGALALAVHPADTSINRHLATSQSANVLFKPGSIIGEGYTILPAAAAIYAFGRLEHEQQVAHLGMDEIEGGILAESIVEIMKVSIRRPRPRPNIGQPFTASGYSFPSGHSTLTFEAATILQQHLGYRAGIPTYLIASYVAISRLHYNVHYASDVAFGAGLGIMIGRSVTWHGRNFWGYNLTTSPMVVPHGAGIIIVAHAAPTPAPDSDR